jgi:hypothetical protein
LVQNHKYSLSDIEMMIPWEREVYLDMLVNDIKEQNAEHKRQNING